MPKPVVVPDLSEEEKNISYLGTTNETVLASAKTEEVPDSLRKIITSKDTTDELVPAEKNIQPETSLNPVDKAITQPLQQIIKGGDAILTVDLKAKVEAFKVCNLESATFSKEVSKEVVQSVQVFLKQPEIKAKAYTNSGIIYYVENADGSIEFVTVMTRGAIQHGTATIENGEVKFGEKKTAFKLDNNNFTKTAFVSAIDGALALKIEEIKGIIKDKKVVTTESLKVVTLEDPIKPPYENPAIESATSVDKNPFQLIELREEGKESILTQANIIAKAKKDAVEKTTKILTSEGKCTEDKINQYAGFLFKNKDSLSDSRMEDFLDAYKKTNIGKNDKKLEKMIKERYEASDENYDTKIEEMDKYINTKIKEMNEYIKTKIDIILCKEIAKVRFSKIEQRINKAKQSDNTIDINSSEKEALIESLVNHAIDAVNLLQDLKDKKDKIIKKIINDGIKVTENDPLIQKQEYHAPEILRKKVEEKFKNQSMKQNIWLKIKTAVDAKKYVEGIIEERLGRKIRAKLKDYADKHPNVELTKIPLDQFFTSDIYDDCLPSDDDLKKASAE